MSNSTAEIQNNMHAPVVTEHIFVSGGHDVPEKCIKLKGTIQPITPGTVQEYLWFYDAPVACYVMCDFEEQSEDLPLLNFETVSKPEFSENLVHVTVYTANSNVGFGTDNRPTTTSRGVKVRVQSGAGGI